MSACCSLPVLKSISSFYIYIYISVNACATNEIKFVQLNKEMCSSMFIIKELTGWIYMSLARARTTILPDWLKLSSWNLKMIRANWAFWALLGNAASSLILYRSCFLLPYSGWNLEVLNKAKKGKDRPISSTFDFWEDEYFTFQ